MLVVFLKGVSNLGDFDIEQRFLSMLRFELDSRIRSNQKYSMRAFARYLGVEPSALSKILSEKRKLSPEKRMGFAKSLGWDMGTLFPSLDRQSNQPEFMNVARDQEELVTTWYHYAILELARIKSYVPTSTFIARNLGISRFEAKAALDRLKRLRMLDARGRLVTDKNRTTTVGNARISGDKLRQLQKKMLEKAIQALDLTPEAERDQSTMVMAIPSRLLTEAKEELKKFRRKFCSNYDALPDIDRVYHLSVSFYPVSPKIDS